MSMTIYISLDNARVRISIGFRMCKNVWICEMNTKPGTDSILPLTQAKGNCRVSCIHCNPVAPMRRLQSLGFFLEKSIANIWRNVFHYTLMTVFYDPPNRSKFSKCIVFVDVRFVALDVTFSTSTPAEMEVNDSHQFKDKLRFGFCLFLLK